MPLPVGTKAPNFTLKTQTPEGLVDVTLSENLGQKNIVLLFFPAAFTGVCTQEMCNATEGFCGFENAEVWGISVDSPFAQAAWAKQNGITIKLLSDYRREVVKAYDVVWPDLAGLGPSAARAAFVIDKEGIIRYGEQTSNPTELPDFESIQGVLKKLEADLPTKR